MQKFVNEVQIFMIPKRLRALFKAVSAVLVFTLVFLSVQRVVTIDTEDMSYGFMRGIYEEKENSLDAVYIGSSDCYAFWSPTLAWKEYGINVCTYTCPRKPLTVTEYMMKEARKTQPDALYIVNINTLGEKPTDDVVMHRLLDNMPNSILKWQLAQYLFDSAELSFSQRLQYYFPIIRYHSRWNQLSVGNLARWVNDKKNGNVQPAHLKIMRDISSAYHTSSERADISELLKDSLESLLDYCDAEKVKVLFVTVPRAEDKLSDVKKYNTVNDYVSKRGYPVLELNSQVDKIGLDLKSDYYNNKHLNIHGAIKYTRFLSEYLVENYGFKDKRNDPSYASWDSAVEVYGKVIAPYVFDIEMDNAKRNYSMNKPQGVSCEKAEQTYRLSWKAVPGARGYAVYQKLKGDAWTKVGETSLTEYTGVLEPETEYNYTVVPFTVKDGERLYGNFNYLGVK